MPQLQIIKKLLLKLEGNMDSKVQIISVDIKKSIYFYKETKLYIDSLFFLDVIAYLDWGYESL